MSEQNSANRDALLVAILILITFQPYFTWFFPISLSGIATYVSAIFILKYRKKYIQPCSLILFLLYLFISIRGQFSFFGFIANFCVISIVLARKEFIVMVFEQFRKIYAVVTGLSLIVYILVLFAGVNLPYQELEPLNSDKIDVYYRTYPLLAMYYNYGIPLPRFCGIFDEPGVIGTISGVLLILSQFNLKDKYNIPILLSGVFSASLFFIVLCIFAILFLLKGKYKIIGITSVVILFYIAASNEITSQLITERLVIEDGHLAGDSRSSHLSETWYNNFIRSNNVYFGLGNNAHLIYNEGGCSYKDLIIDYGIVCFLLFCLCFLIPVMVNKRIHDVFLFALIFFSVIYQRPFITTLGYVFLLVAAMYPSEIESFEKSNFLMYKK